MQMTPIPAPCAPKLAPSLYRRDTDAKSRGEIRLAELVGLLSHALDMTEGQPPGHCIRCAWIGTHIGLDLGMTGGDLADLYYTLLLKDLGCSSNAARICQLYLTDDIRFKKDFKTIDDSLSSALRFVFAKTGLASGLSERFRAIVNILQNGGQISRDLIEARCHRGADIAARMRFSDGVQAGIRCLDEHWNGSGKPQGLQGDSIPRAANIALLAQVADVFRADQGIAAAVAEVNARSGTWFDPALVAAFNRTQSQAGFWDALTSGALEKQVFALPPAAEASPVDDDYLDDIAAAFSDVVDAKSPFTADHSARVTLYADIIAEELGLTQDHRRWFRRAALLHDLGKLAISNQILDKPAKLDADEWLSVKSHPWHSERILERLPAFADIAPIAGAHHERLDGKGYPGGLVADQISLEMRILTVADVFDALSAARPYRDAMPLDQVFGILETDIGTAFDGACVAALQLGIARLQAALPDTITSDRAMLPPSILHKVSAGTGVQRSG